MGRVIPGIAMAAFWVVFLLTAPPLLFWGVISVFGTIGLYEYYRMSCGFLTGSFRFMTIGATLLPLLCAVYGRLDVVCAGLFGCLLICIFIIFKFYSTLDDVLGLLALNSFGALYISFCMAHLVLIRFLPQGHYWLLMLTAITACSDTGAYYAGRTFGRRKLCPNISPGKTVAGAVGGGVAGLFGALVIGQSLFPTLSLGGTCVLALVLAPIGIVGDLTESVAKRSAGVKDSGTLLAGHGGLLDRMDSLLLTGPALFFLLYFKVVA